MSMFVRQQNMTYMYATKLITIHDWRIEMKNKIKEVCRAVEKKHIYKCSVICIWSVKLCVFRVIENNIVKTMKLPYFYVRWVPKSIITDVLLKCLNNGCYDILLHNKEDKM